MNRIVLIGNGFDLAHGLKTSYKDFIDDYWKTFIHKTVLTYNVKEYKEDGAIIRTNYTSLSGFVDIVERDKAANYNDILKIISEVKEHYELILEINFENKILKNITENSFVNWVDIEDEYYKFLTFEFHKLKFNRYEYADIKDINRDFNLIKNKLIEYLKQIQSDTTIQISSKILDIIYSRYYIDEFTEQEKSVIFLKETEEKLNHKEAILNNKLPAKTLELLSNHPIDKDFFRLKLSDRKFWDKYFDLIPKDCMFLSFNYTSTANNYINLKNKEINGYIPIVINIHGELNNPENPIIFGYGDELEENYSKLENLNDNAYLENIKSIKYQETDNYKQMLNFINSDKYQIIILGHSCGNSDRTLLNTLFEHENCVSIKPYYYQYKDEKTGEIKDNYSDIVRNISRSFTDKKSMRDKVVNKTYTDWFSQKLD